MLLAVCLIWLGWVLFVVIFVCLLVVGRYVDGFWFACGHEFGCGFWIWICLLICLVDDVCMPIRVCGLLIR